MLSKSVLKEEDELISLGISCFAIGANICGLGVGRGCFFTNEQFLLYKHGLGELHEKERANELEACRREEPCNWMTGDKPSRQT